MIGLLQTHPRPPNLGIVKLPLFPLTLLKVGGDFQIKTHDLYRRWLFIGMPPAGFSSKAEV